MSIPKPDVSLNIKKMIFLKS